MLTTSFTKFATVTNSQQVLEPTTPPQRVPLAVLSTDAQIQLAP
ncbi:hypothetical protein [Mycobacterium sp. ACS1612]|nr:hypothetical protein [Mycobacterium sp. ACS1612]